MIFFWIMILMTVIVVSFNFLISNNLELVILLFIIDFITLWTYTESGKKTIGKINLTEKIENLERLISDVFNKLNSRPSNEEKDKEELLEALNNF